MSKYHNKRTNGYASAKEAKRAAELNQLEHLGLISGLLEQVVYTLAPSVVIQGRKRPPLRYIADFTYYDGKLMQSPLIVEDVKGRITDGYRIKRHLMKSVHNIDILES